MKLPNTKEKVFENYSKLFEGLGCIPGFININLKSDAIPITQAQRRVPLALNKKT